MTPPPASLNQSVLGFLLLWGEFRLLGGHDGRQKKRRKARRARKQRKRRKDEEGAKEESGGDEEGAAEAWSLRYPAPIVPIVGTTPATRLIEDGGVQRAMT